MPHDCKKLKLTDTGVEGARCQDGMNESKIQASPALYIGFPLVWVDVAHKVVSEMDLSYMNKPTVPRRVAIASFRPKQGWGAAMQQMKRCPDSRNRPPSLHIPTPINLQWFTV